MGILNRKMVEIYQNSFIKLKEVLNYSWFIKKIQENDLKMFKFPCTF